MKISSLFIYKQQKKEKNKTKNQITYNLCKLHIMVVIVMWRRKTELEVLQLCSVNPLSY